MMKKLSLLIYSVCLSLMLSAQDMSYFTPEYLDTVTVRKNTFLNDYSMIGIQYGYTGSMVLWNPRFKQDIAYRPVNVGIMFSKYGKMFGYMPYFGFQAGLFYTQEGYKFKEDKDTGYMARVEGADEAVISEIEMPFIAHCHADINSSVKLLMNLGLFLGYRTSIERIGEYVNDASRNSFVDTDKRFDYGLKAGVGIAYVFDPVELHLQLSCKQSLNSLYLPQTYSPYYYRFAYPMNFIASAGIHFQLSKRYGKTSKALRNEARKKVYQNVTEN